MKITGMVGADGKSVLPDTGLYDMAELGDALNDPELEARVAAIAKEDEATDGLRAKYKLEVIFTEARSVHAPFIGIVMAWSNGGFMHGGGDEAIYFCPSPVPSANGGTTLCREPISLQFISRRVAVCAKCKAVIVPEKLIGQFLAKLPTEKWATLLTKMFGILGCNADIRIGTMRGDLRRANEKEDEKYARGEHLDKVRNARSWVVYPLRNIIKDTAAGADLHARMRAFLSA